MAPPNENGSERLHAGCLNTAGLIPDVLRVSSMRHWVANDLRVGAAGRFPVLADMGLDVPVVEGSVAWWAPAEHVARLAVAGVHLDLAAPGPRWLADLDVSLTGRVVWAGRLADIADAPRSGWAKPAEAKVEALPARWWDAIADFAEAAAAAGVSGDAWVQVCPTDLDIVEEHRCFVAYGHVVASSPYLLADGSTYEPGWEDREDLATSAARTFATEVVAALGDNQPVAYTLDVARSASGRFVVLEGNPAWCSGFYGAALDAVVDAVVASSWTPQVASDVPVGERCTSRHGRFAWVPDAVLVQRAARLPILAPFTPSWSRIDVAAAAALRQASSTLAQPAL